MKPVCKRFSTVLFALLALLLVVSMLPMQALAVEESDTVVSGSDSVTDTGNASDSVTDTGGDTDTDSSGSNTDASDETEDLGRIHGGYAFTDDSTLTADVGGKYPLSTKTFGSSALSAAEGYREGAMKGYVALDNIFFSNTEELSMGFWTKFSLDSARGKSTLFRVSGKNGESLELSFSAQGRGVLLRLTVKDGTRTATCSYDLSTILTDAETWNHFAFTYKKFGNASMIQLYVNGESSGTSTGTAFADISSMVASAAAFQGIVVDELYVTNYALERAKISSMMNQPVATYYALQQKEIDGGSSENPDGGTDPIVAHTYAWAAYLFEGTYNPGADYNGGAIVAAVDNACARVDSANLKEKFGFGMVRREGSAPAYYLKADSRLLRAQPSFTFACWVYRDGTSASNEECLLDLSGRGVLRFAPYAVSADGKGIAYLEYTDSRGRLQHSTIGNGTLSSPMGEWVHYALTVAQNGTIVVYVDGVPQGTFASGVSPADWDFTDCRLVTGASSSDPTRTVLDEVYFAPKVWGDAEVRKMRYYGLAEYTSKVLPDPGTGEESPDDPSNILAPNEVDIAEDAFSKIGTILNGFIGTTFDEHVAVGRDWNNGAEATVTGGKLTNGVSSFGLLLDGATSFLRYPIGILDGADSLTISLSYSWAGTTSAASRSQRLFDFSRKASSVSAPSAYIYLETGLGFGGLKFGMSDGIRSTFLTYDYNEIDTWTRVTVTVADGTATLYVNGEAVDSVSTGVDLASICPNFCYVGRSGVKGDPLFKGSVDEIYISNKALAAEEVGRWSNGISAAVNGTVAEETDLWSTVIRVIIIVAAVLVVSVIVAVIVIITKREKKPKAEIPAPPAPRRDAPPPSEQPPVLGPRSARRARMEAGEEDSDATVKFRKVREDVPATEPDPDATTEFRKVDPDRNEE